MSPDIEWMQGRRFLILKIGSRVLKTQHFISMFAAVLIACVPVFAQAKTPPEVLAPYKKYVSALEAGNIEEAGKQAERAYDEAIRVLDSEDPLIGSLAHNLADLYYDEPDEQIKLYRHAIALTPLATSDDIVIAAQRWVALGQAHAVRPAERRNDFKLGAKDISKGWDFIEENALEATTFGGDMMVLKGWSAASQNRVREALNWFEKADAVFSGPDHQYFSILEYMNKVLHGKTLITDDRNIEGALVLQDVMQNVEGELPADHPYVTGAFYSWLGARSKIEQNGNTEKAEAAGVCKCWPYDEMSAKAPIPIRRIPPKMPSTARQSGKVMMRFDVTREGRTVNIETVGYTNKVFMKSATRAVKKWQYDVTDEHEDADLQSIMTTISFLLFSEEGNVLPEDDMTILIAVGE